MCSCVHLRLKILYQSPQGPDRVKMKKNVVAFVIIVVAVAISGLCREAIASVALRSFFPLP